jgi:hypothetical protein
MNEHRAVLGGVANPAYDPATDNILVFGFRARLVF